VPTSWRHCNKCTCRLHTPDPSDDAHAAAGGVWPSETAQLPRPLICWFGACLRLFAQAPPFAHKSAGSDHSKSNGGGGTPASPDTVQYARAVEAALAEVRRVRMAEEALMATNVAAFERELIGGIGSIEATYRATAASLEASMREYVARQRALVEEAVSRKVGGWVDGLDGNTRWRSRYQES
jgi:hypothetical protein